MKTSELTGPALAWAVEYALLSYVANEEMRAAVASRNQRTKGIGYSINWAIGGPVIERERIAIKPFRDGGEWLAKCKEAQQDGPTALVAAMRCFVASRLGDEVEVPAELKD